LTDFSNNTSIINFNFINDTASIITINKTNEYKTIGIIPVSTATNLNTPLLSYDLKIKRISSFLPILLEITSLKISSLNLVYKLEIKTNFEKDISKLYIEGSFADRDTANLLDSDWTVLDSITSSNDFYSTPRVILSKPINFPDTDFYHFRVRAKKINSTNYIQIAGNSKLSINPKNLNNTYLSKLICYPNPFSSTIYFTNSLINISKITLIVYDILGRVVTRVLNDFSYEVSNSNIYAWNGKNFNGEPVASGIYFVKLIDLNTKQIVVNKVVKIN
jgi:hypothetical protein